MFPAESLSFARMYSLQDDCQLAENTHIAIHGPMGKCKDAYMNVTARTRCWDHMHGMEAHYVWGPWSMKTVPIWYVFELTGSNTME